MILHQLYRIGKKFYAAGEDPVDILIRLQNKVQSGDRNKTPRILTIIADVQDPDPEKITFTCKLVDYDPSREKDYLLGLTPGTATSYSPTLSPGWKEKGKDRNIKFRWIYRIAKNKNIKKLEDPPEWLLPFFIAIQQREKELQETVSEYLVREGKTSFQQPLIFRFKDNERIKWPGEIPTFRRLYEILFLEDVDKSLQGAKCSICGNTHGLRQGFQIGMYTTDQDSFLAHYFESRKKLNFQYLMCTDCYLLSLLGFVIVRDQLNFYAYGVQVKGKRQNIYHYIIPTTENEDTLKNAIDLISQAKVRAEKRRKANLTRQIQDINNKIQRAKRKQERKPKKEIKKLEKKKTRLEEWREEERDELPITDLLSQAYEQKRYPSLIDFYYRITNAKITPKSKQLVGEVELSGKHLEILAKVLKKTENQFGSVALSALQDIVDQSHFLYYYSALLGMKPIDKDLFYKRVSEILKERFVHKLIGYKDPQAKKVLGFRYPLRNYQKFEYIFSELNLWR